MANKRQAKHLDAGRPVPVGRILSALAALALLGGLAWGAARLADPQAVPVERIRVEGRLDHLAPSELEAVIGAQLDGGFFSLDVRAVQRAVEALPWVDRAAVRRIWPATLVVTVQEQEAMARWAAGGLVNRRGEVFFPDSASYPAALPVLSGPSDTAGLVAARYVAMSEQLAHSGLAVEQVGLDERRAWRVRLSGGVELLLGRHHTEARLERFARVYAPVLQERAAELVRVDLRYSNGFAVKWKDTGETGRT